MQIPVFDEKFEAPFIAEWIFLSKHMKFLFFSSPPSTLIFAFCMTILAFLIILVYE